jgi:hypothetical protein
MVFVADALGGWLVGLLADAGRKKLATWVLGSEQERALRSAATAAVRLTAQELRPDDAEQAEGLAMVVSQVFSGPVPGERLAGQATVLEALQSAIAGQLAPLDDPGLTGMGQSSADALGISAAALAEKLTGYLVREIVVRGASSGPLAPLADQLNHDATHLQGQRLEGMLVRLTGIVLEVARKEDSHRLPGGRQKCVLVIGAANEEYVLDLPEHWEVGQKYTATSHSFVGGSGVNYTRRLLHYGACLAIPIIPVGRDIAGEQIRAKILNDLPFGLDQQVRHTLENPDQFFVNGLRTQRSTILVGSEARTIFTEKRTPAQLTKFTEYLLGDNDRSSPGRLASLDAQLDVVGVVIGHILSDSREVSEKMGIEPGRCTRKIISQYSGSGKFIFANPGESQIRLTKEFWEKDFMQLDVLQLNLNEIKLLFKHEKTVDASLLEIVDWLAERHITTVITLDKLGAVCVCCPPGGPVDIIIALPLRISGLEDTTGAGDAFGAAIVTQLYLRQMRLGTHQRLESHEWVPVLEEARYWAAYACTTRGGAEDCPSETELKSLRKRIREEGNWSRVDLKGRSEAESILFLLDRAYSSVQN